MNARLATRLWLALSTSLLTALAATVTPAYADPAPFVQAHHPRRAITAPSTSKGQKVQRGRIAAAAAVGQLGVSFSWGGGSIKGATLGIGRGATTKGFDCSGLTLYAWSRAGVSLAHYTGTQFRQGRRIPLSARRTGDLLFFGGGTGDPTHVALFLGGGVMIHAPKTGDVVRRTNFVTSPYYRTTYRGTVRPG
ncbi:NlpC/P60 family protein [Nonomuraea sp. NPDC002799]